MTKVTLTRGYSASGKTTWARQQGAVVVCRDDIRAQITGHDDKTVLDPAGEKLVTAIQKAQITAAVKAGANVIVADTNLNPKFARQHIDLAVSLGAEWEVKDFTLDANTCLAMNIGRKDEVPADVIRTQAKRYPMPWTTLTASETPDATPYVPDTTKPKAILIDLDNTLAILAKGYSPYDPKHYPHDTLHQAVKDVIDMADKDGVYILILSGREGSTENADATMQWLAKHGVGYDALIMRKEGDKRRDDIIKMELFNEHVRDHYNVLFAVDDRLRVVDAYRARGISVLEANRGDF